MNRAGGAGQPIEGRLSPASVSPVAAVCDLEAMPQMDGPPNSNAGDDVRGRRTSNVPSQSGSRAGSVSRSNLGSPFPTVQLNRNVDYPANVYNMYSQVSHGSRLLLIKCRPVICLSVYTIHSTSHSVFTARQSAVCPGTSSVSAQTTKPLHNSPMFASCYCIHDHGTPRQL